MTIRRRDLVQLGVGAGAGLMLSPVPWKLLDDTAIWSQNWSWLPKLPTGERTVKQGRCTLCPGGCAVEAQCVGGTPVYLKGTGGPLCTLGIGGHHLAYHPDRIRTGPVPLDAAVGRIHDAAGRGPALVLDLRPGHAMSEVYRRFASLLPDGRYAVVPPRDGDTLRTMERLSGLKNGSLGVNFDRLKTVIGVGTPLMDGWPEQARLVASRKAGLRIVQIDARESATATAADEWHRTVPGAEVRKAIELAAQFERDGPVILIADGDPGSAGFSTDELEAVASANLRCAREVLVLRTPLPWITEPDPQLESVPDRSLRLLILGDATSGDAVAWKALERKLAPGALVVSLSPYLDALSRRADLVLPTPATYESGTDVTTPPYAKESAYAAAPALHPKPLGGMPPAEVLKAITPPLDLAPQQVIEQRLAAVPKPESQPAASRLKETVPREVREAEAPALAAVFFGWRGTNGAGIASPLITKLYQESGLRPASMFARIHPDTGRSLGLEHKGRASLHANGAVSERTVVFDPGVARGNVEVADASPGCRWAPAELRRIA